MAYTAVLTREGVSLQGEQYSITIRCIVNDGVDDVFDEALTAKYKLGDDIEGWKRDVLSYFKNLWDTYVAEQTMFDHPLLIAAVADLQDQANAYL